MMSGKKNQQSTFMNNRSLAKGNVKNRETGIEIIGTIPWGTHLCQFYQTKEDIIDILVPYFKAGLENNEFCMWITSEPLRVNDARKALSKKVKNLEKYIQNGQIEILDSTEWYTKSGKFDTDEVLQGWIFKEKQTLEMKEHLQNVIDSASEVIISIDANKRITTWNKSAEILTGYKQTDVLNWSITKLTMFENTQKLLDLIKYLSTETQPSYEDLVINTKNSVKKVLRVTGSSIKEKQGSGVLFIGRDITREIEIHG